MEMKIHWHPKISMFGKDFDFWLAVRATPTGGKDCLVESSNPIGQCFSIGHLWDVIAGQKHFFIWSAVSIESNWARKEAVEGDWGHINKEQIRLYHDIGLEILDRQNQQGWVPRWSNGSPWICGKLFQIWKACPRTISNTCGSLPRTVLILDLVSSLLTNYPGCTSWHWLPKWELLNYRNGMAGKLSSRQSLLKSCEMWNIVWWRYSRIE